MIWAQFFNLSTGYIAGTSPAEFGERKLIEACGSDAVFVLDGRNARHTQHEHAKEVCKQRKYLAYQLYKGEGFNRPHVAISPVIKVNHE